MTSLLICPAGTSPFAMATTSNWKVHLVDTGLYTETGGRLKRLAKWLEGDETLMFTYGDGIANR